MSRTVGYEVDMSLSFGLRSGYVSAFWVMKWVRLGLLVTKRICLCLLGYELDMSRPVGYEVGVSRPVGYEVGVSAYGLRSECVSACRLRSGYVSACGLRSCVSACRLRSKQLSSMD